MYVLKISLFFAFLFSSINADSQIKSVYNWKGSTLPLYEKPDTGSRVLLKIPKGAEVKQNVSQAVLPAFNIILSYYGITELPEKKELTSNGGTWYSMPGTWTKVKYQDKTGYVSQLFLSCLPDLQVAKNSKDDFEELTTGYLTRFFGTPVSRSKKELPKGSKDEINYQKTYRFKNGNYQISAYQYFEKDGPGGETHTLFLKGLKKHEAILLLLKLTSYNDSIDLDFHDVKKRVVTNSLYDKFCWWYNKDLDKGTMKERNIDMEFFFYQEGGSASITLKEITDGVIIAYSYGGC